MFMDMQNFFLNMTNFGFPIMLSWYLLIRLEKRIEETTLALNRLITTIATQKT